MHSLAVLLVATPVFGLTLEPPAIEPIADLSANATLLAYLQDAEAGESEDGDADAEQAEYLRQVKKRNSLAKVHRPLGLATWAAMTVTVTLGVIQYYNLYG